MNNTSASAEVLFMVRASRALEEKNRSPHTLMWSRVGEISGIAEYGVLREWRQKWRDAPKPKALDISRDVQRRSAPLSHLHLSHNSGLYHFQRPLISVWSRVKDRDDEYYAPAGLEHLHELTERRNVQ